MLLSQIIFSSTLLLFIVLIHILYCIVLYCIVLYYSDLEHFCGFYAIQNKLSIINSAQVWLAHKHFSNTVHRKVPWFFCNKIIQNVGQTYSI